jgi:hypothetical protein
LINAPLPSPVHRREHATAPVHAVVRMSMAAAILLLALWGRSELAGPRHAGVARMIKPPARIQTSVMQQMKSALQTIQRGYGASNWREVDGAFSDVRVASAYTGEMRQWKYDAGGTLRVQLVSTVPTTDGRYVATVRFAGDPRAVPNYHIFVFAPGPRGLRIVGTTTGLQGSSYRDTNWSISRSAHFVIFHSPYALLGTDAQGLQSLESQRTTFERRFGIKVPAHIAYYLYPQQNLIATLTSNTCGSNPDNVGCTLQYANPPTIHTSEWVSYHEPIHVYQTAMEPNGYTAPLFISEGMAVALEDREVDPRKSDYCSEVAYVPLDDCAQYAITQTRPITLLSDDGFDKADAGYAYSLGGSFVKYLILAHGYRSFGRFYYDLAAQPSDGVQNYNVATERVYHAGIRALLHDWQLSLCRTGCG